MMCLVKNVRENRILIPDEPLKSCFDSEHDVCEDVMALMFAKERVFYCLTCRKCFICLEDIDNGRLVVKEVLSLPITNEEIAKHLHFEEEIREIGLNNVM